MRVCVHMLRMRLFECTYICVAKREESHNYYFAFYYTCTALVFKGCFVTVGPYVYVPFFNDIFDKDFFSSYS